MSPRTRQEGRSMPMFTGVLAALVLAILIPFREAIVAAVTNALASVTTGG